MARTRDLGCTGPELRELERRLRIRHLRLTTVSVKKMLMPFFNRRLSKTQSHKWGLSCRRIELENVNEARLPMRKSMTSDHRVAGSSPAGCKSSARADLRAI
jgi:hypothetical protein